jgi:hypothetical protein
MRGPALSNLIKTTIPAHLWSFKMDKNCDALGEIAIGEDFSRIEWYSLGMSTEESSNTSTPPDSGESKPNPQGLIRALELMELGIALTRQRIARENPGILPEELTARMNQWLSSPRNERRQSPAT